MPNIRISQIFTNGGGPTASPAPTYNRDFVELFNPTQKPIDVTGWALHTTSATSTATWARIQFANVSNIIPPGGYYLVSIPGGVVVATNTLVPDLVAIGGGMGTTCKVALTTTDSTISGANPTANVIDKVGFGASATGFEGSPIAATGTNILGVRRNISCVDTNVNSADFSLVTPLARNSSTPPEICPATQLNLNVSASASPTTISVLGTQITYTVPVENWGTDLAGGTNVTVVATFPLEIDFAGSFPSGTYDPATRQLTVNLGAIEGAPATLPLQVLGIAAANGPSVGLTFGVSAIEADSNLSNNSATATVAINESADLQISLAAEPCGTVLSLSNSLPYTVTVTNNGAATSQNTAATINLSKNLTYNASSNTTTGTLANNSGVVTWAIGVLAPNTTVTATINANVFGNGGILTTSTVTSSTFDIVATNNSAFANNIAPKASVGHQVVFSSQSGNPNNAIPGDPSAFFTVDIMRRPFPSPDGTKFIATALSTGGTTTDEIVVIGTTGPSPTLEFVVREAITVVPNGETIGLIDLGMGINNAGTYTFSSNTTPANNNTTADEIVYKGTGTGANVVLTDVAREGSQVPSMDAGVLYGSTNNSCGIDNQGRVCFVSLLTGTGIITTGTSPLPNNQAFFTQDGNLKLLQKAVDFPTGFFNGLGAWETIQGFGSEWRPTTINADGTRYIATGDVSTNATAFDDILVVDGVVKIQGGSPIPGTNFASVMSNSLPAFAHMDGDANWYAYGSNADGFDWVLRNGLVIAERGGPIFTGSTEVWTDTAVNPSFSQTFFLFTGRGDDYVVGGVSNNSDTWGNGVVVHNNTTAIIREGDPIDLNNDGIANDDAYIAVIRDDRAFIGSDRALYVVVQHRTQAQQCTAGNTNPPGSLGTLQGALLRIPLPASGPVCLADVASDGLDTTRNPNGSVGAEDLDAFIAGFIAENVSIADVAGDGLDTTYNPNGAVGAEDLDAFIAAFVAGC